MPGMIPTMLVAVGIKEDNLPRLGLTPLWERVLESAENGM